MVPYRRRAADISRRRAEPPTDRLLRHDRPTRSRWGIAFGFGALTMFSVRSLLGLQNTSPSAPPPPAAAAVVDSSARSVMASPGGLLERPGWYMYAPDSGQTLVIERAIDQGVAHLFPLVRGIARGRLKGTNRLPHTLQVVITPDSVGTQLDANKPMNLPRSGTTVRWDDGMGDVCRAREIIVADTLMQLCAADRGSSVARYVFEDGGETLRRIVHITSPHLSGPVDYAIVLRRLSDRVNFEPRSVQLLPGTRVVAEEAPMRDGPDQRGGDP
jgi:hypothetical protein